MFNLKTVKCAQPSKWFNLIRFVPCYMRFEGCILIGFPKPVDQLKYQPVFNGYTLRYTFKGKWLKLNPWDISKVKLLYIL